MPRQTPVNELLPGARLLIGLGPSSALAKKAGVSSRSFDKWKRGAVPSRSNQLKLETALNVPVTAWQAPATPLERELATSLASWIGKALLARHEQLQGTAQLTAEAL